MQNPEAPVRHTDSDPRIIAQKQYLERLEAYHQSFSDFMNKQLLPSDVETRFDEYGKEFSVAKFDQYNDAASFVEDCGNAQFDVEIVEPAPGRPIAPHEKCFKVRQKKFISLNDYIESNK